jgi:hypothetical protein
VRVVVSALSGREGIVGQIRDDLGEVTDRKVCEISIS